MTNQTGIKKSLNIKGRLFDVSSPRVMGILNITPDSFYDGGRFEKKSDYLKRAEEMVHEGVDIIDIGAYSSRPGAEHISEAEELERLMGPLKEIRKHFPEIIISIDTFRSGVASQAVYEGADIINDISAGDADPMMFDTIASLGVPYIIMHMQGRPSNMQKAPEYSNVIKEVMQYLGRKVDALNLKGVRDVIIDPGFGFGKTIEHNYALLKGLEMFGFLDTPVLVGLSRKSMINKVLEKTPQDALNGTTVLHTISLLNGANILRVHDVSQAIETIKLVSLYKQTRV